MDLKLLTDIDVSWQQFGIQFGRQRTAANQPQFSRVFAKKFNVVLSDQFTGPTSLFENELHVAPNVLGIFSGLFAVSRWRKKDFILGLCQS